MKSCAAPTPRVRTSGAEVNNGVATAGAEGTDAEPDEEVPAEPPPPPQPTSKTTNKAPISFKIFFTLRPLILLMFKS